MPPRTRPARLPTIAVVALAATVLGQAPASAETRSKADRVGEAPRVIDISGFTVRNDRDRAVVTVDIPELGKRGGVGVEYSPSRFGGLYVDAHQTRTGPVVSATFCGELRCDDHECDGFRVTWSVAKHQVRFVIPHRCHPGTVPDPGVFHVSSGSNDGYDMGGTLWVDRG